LPQEEYNEYVMAHRKLAAGLAAATERLKPVDAARVLNQALAKEKDANVRRSLADILAAVAGRLEPAEGARECAEAIRLFIEAIDQDSGDQTSYEGGISGLIQVLESADAEHAARVLAGRIVCARNPNYQDAWFDRPSILERFLTHAARPEARRRAATIASTIGTAAKLSLTTLPFLPDAGKPLPCRLTTQDLVEFLKMPTCFGQVRQVILNQLGNRYGRRFDTHWDFVRYAQEQNLNLDFTTPPNRADPKLPQLFEP
jgi:hypothetical protein